LPLINKLDIALPKEVDYVARSAITQARKKLGSNVVKDVFHQTAHTWHKRATIGSGGDSIYMVLTALFGEHLTQRDNIRIKSCILQLLG